MGSLTIGATQQTVLRYHTINTEIARRRILQSRNK